MWWAYLLALVEIGKTDRYVKIWGGGLALRPPAPTGLGLTVAVGTLLADTVYNNDECIMISPESGSSSSRDTLYSRVIWPSSRFIVASTLNYLINGEDLIKGEGGTY